MFLEKCGFREMDSNGYHCELRLCDQRIVTFDQYLCFLVVFLRVVSIIFHSVYDTRVS